MWWTYFKQIELFQFLSHPGLDFVFAVRSCRRRNSRSLLLISSKQPDAHECILLFVDIMHHGSKYYVLDHPENDIVTDSRASLCNIIFFPLCEKEICCGICKSLPYLRIASATKLMYSARGTDSYRVPITPDAINKMYWAVVVPKMAYGLEVTPVSETGYEIVENAHRNHAKLIQGLPQTQP